jgi:hypothetical protein
MLGKKGECGNLINENRTIQVLDIIAKSSSVFVLTAKESSIYNLRIALVLCQFAIILFLGTLAEVGMAMNPLPR